VRVTPYQFVKIHPELGLRPQAVYQHCLKQAAPYSREKSGRIIIDDNKFLAWFTKRRAAKQLKAAQKQPKLKVV
jgi:hypothetical protein